MNDDLTTPSDDRRALAVRRCGGFSLIEVCLAVLVIGLGLLPVFSLLPSGLRSGEESTADTRCGLFAESVMNGLRGNAASITNWSDWTAQPVFLNKIAQNVLSSGGGRVPVQLNYSIVPIQFPDTGSEYLRYRLNVSVNAAGTPFARLEVCEGQYGAFSPQAIAYTEFVFRGF